MKNIYFRIMCILLANVILVVCCSCGKQNTSKNFTQPTETPTDDLVM